MKDKIIEILQGQNMEIHEYNDKIIIITDHYRIDVYREYAYYKLLTAYHNETTNKKFKYNGIETFHEIKKYIEWYKNIKIEELRRI